jgi:hypothetical protein
MLVRVVVEITTAGMFAAGIAIFLVYSGVNTPLRPPVFPVYILSMKNNSTKITRTFGEFVTSVYDLCGKRKAGRIVQIAIKSQLIEFCGQQRVAIS